MQLPFAHFPGLQMSEISQSFPRNKDQDEKKLYLNLISTQSFLENKTDPSELIKKLMIKFKIKNTKNLT